MATYGNRPPIPPKNATENTKLHLSGEAWNASNPAKRPAGNLRVHKGEAWFSIYANHPDEDDKAQRINIKYGILDAYNILSTIRMQVKNPDMERVKFEAWNYTFVNGQRSDKPCEQGSVTVGRNGEGAVMLVAQFPNRPTCQFIFGATYWTHILDSTNAPVSKRVASEIVASGWCDALNHLLGVVAEKTYVDYAAEKRKKQSSSGGVSSTNDSAAPQTTSNADTLFG